MLFYNYQIEDVKVIIMGYLFGWWCFDLKKLVLMVRG